MADPHKRYGFPSSIPKRPKKATPGGPFVPAGPPTYHCPWPPPCRTDFQSVNPTGLKIRPTVAATKNHPLPFTQGREPRAAIEVRVRPAEDGPEIRFIGTHLEHADESLRLVQAKRLNELFARDDPSLVILAGDLNAAPDSPPMKALLQRWSPADPKDPKPTFPLGQAPAEDRLRLPPPTRRLARYPMPSPQRAHRLRPRPPAGCARVESL
jgi:hypothetical protein